MAEKIYDARGLNYEILGSLDQIIYVAEALKARVQTFPSTQNDNGASLLREMEKETRETRIKLEFASIIGLI